MRKPLQMDREKKDYIKMNLPRNSIAMRALLFAVSLLTGALAYAGQATGTVTHLSGPLLVKKEDGNVKALAQNSTVEHGDTLVTEKNTYARIKFSDNSEITMRPNSQLKIDSFSFDEAKPEEDKASFELIKGGLRAITGILGKRNNERATMKTPAATIGIRGTTYIVEYTPPDPAHGTATDTPQGAFPSPLLPPLAQNAPSMPDSLSGESRAPGLYVQVLDGMIRLSNSGGAQNFIAGQFGYTPSFRHSPIVLPKNPGLQFIPPPSFAPSSGTADSSNNEGSATDVDCEVP